jgi:hypothetical protein
MKFLVHLRLASLALAALFASTGTAYAAKWYIDNALGTVKPEERLTIAEPQPVQLILEFQRDGKAVPAAVKEIKPWYIGALKARGFTDIVETPTAKGALLSIVMTNVVDKEELARLKKRAVGVGLTFGLGAGVVATDFYKIRFEFVPATGKPPIVTTVEHAMHMKMGNTKEEVNGTQVKNIKEALTGVINQGVDKGVNILASDPGFAAFSAVKRPGA